MVPQSPRGTPSSAKGQTPGSQGCLPPAVIILRTLLTQGPGRSSVSFPGRKHLSPRQCGFTIAWLLETQVSWFQIWLCCSTAISLGASYLSSQRPGLLRSHCNFSLLSRNATKQTEQVGAQRGKAPRVHVYAEEARPKTMPVLPTPSCESSYQSLPRSCPCP